MKRAVVLFALTALLLIGCFFEYPLTTEHNIPVDSAALGLWELMKNGKEEPNQSYRMTILKYSDTEYMIRWPFKEFGTEFYIRGYPIKIGGISCVQLQVIGTRDGPLEKGMKNLFHVASYQLTDGKLIIKLLNTDLVENASVAEYPDSEALRKAFLKHKNNKELFTDPGSFRKIE